MVALIIASIVTLSAVVLQIAVKVVKRRLRSRSEEGEDSLKYRFLNAADGPIILLLIVAGGTLAAETAVAQWQSEQNYTIDMSLITQRAGSAIALAVVAYMSTRLIRVAMAWYEADIAPATSTSFDDQVMPSLRRLAPIVVYSVAGLWMLAIFDIEISPLLATLGIGGIAIALAAQPTLSNYFAGTYVISEGEIAKDDFIEIEGGPSGFVEDISWRSTKLRSRFNNLIIIPNSMMSENMITNYSRPATAMNVIVNGGVSYSSDLNQVHEIIMEAAQQMVVESEYAVTETEPRAGFGAFGDSNIDFWVFMQATDRAGSFQLKSELIKLIHERFNEAGIVINYPVRHLVVDEKKDPNDAVIDAPGQIVELVRNSGD